jgi:hypothetical protein
VYPWRPAGQTYQIFLKQLMNANAELDEGDDELSAVLRAVVAAMRFVDGDPYAVNNMLSRPLAIVANAFRDLLAGGKPHLVFERRHRKSHAPADLSVQAAHGAIGGAIDALIAAGVPRQAAAFYVVRNAQQLRLRIARSGLTVERALRWRDAIGSRAPQLSHNVYCDHIAKRNERLPLQRSDESRAEARRFAIGCLKAIRAAGF